jgi:hypothetical protein
MGDGVWECPCCGQYAQRLGEKPNEAPGAELHATNCQYAYIHGLPRAKLLSTAERYALAAKGLLK